MNHTNTSHRTILHTPDMFTPYLSEIIDKHQKHILFLDEWVGFLKDPAGPTTWTPEERSKIWQRIYQDRLDDEGRMKQEDDEDE